MKIIFYSLITIYLMFFSSEVQAQSNHKFLYGYLVLQEGDTLKGKILPKESKILLYNTKTRKTKSYKNKEIKACKIGRHRFENINGFYRIVIDGPVWYYIKDVGAKNYTNGRQWYDTYYCVKREEESSVTILYIERREKSHRSSINMMEEIVTDAAAHMTLDFLATKKLTPYSNMKIIAKKYFNDCPEIIEDLDKGIYSNTGSIRKLVERYNRFLLSNN